MDKSVFIIAEAGVNHNGSLEIAKELIKIAAAAKVDAIKFQTFVTERGISRYAPKADYQVKLTGKKESQFEMVKKLELSIEEHVELIKCCEEYGILFLSTPFDLPSVDALRELGLDTIKIPSGEIVNLPYLRKVGALGKQIILSTGMATIDEIDKTLEILIESGTPLKDISILHCCTEYPAPMEDINLLAMNTIKDRFKVEVGYSDHSVGIEVPIAAVAMGATIIEKHFTLDKNMKGPDHVASLEPDELKLMVRSIRNIGLALGDGIKRPAKSEQKNIAIARKSIVANKNICKGELFTEDNITVKRPGNGISPMEWDNIIGKGAKKDFKEDEMIELE